MKRDSDLLHNIGPAKIHRTNIEQICNICLMTQIEGGADRVLSAIDLKEADRTLSTPNICCKEHTFCFISHLLIIINPRKNMTQFDL